MLPEVIIILFSLSLGSFLNNMISSFVNNVNLDIFRSYCMCRRKALGIKDLVPLFSYIFSKGRCRYCLVKLSSRYFFVELVSAIVGILCYTRYGLSIQFIIYYLLFQVLIVIGTVDLFSYRIPNLLVIILAVLTVLRMYFSGSSLFLLYNFVAAFFITSIFLMTNYLMLKLKGKEAIGFGDIKLLGVLTLFFNFPVSLTGIWLSAVIGLPGFYLMKRFVSRFNDELKVPFGFFISISFILCGLFDESINGLYYLILGV